MKPAAPPSPDVASPPDTAGRESRSALVRKVAESPRFQRSPKLKSFLLFVCQHALTDPADPLHEQQIGHAVYGRKPDYDTGADNIVRVEARRLRKELESFFADEGLHEQTVITIPKGGYSPLFFARGSAPDVLSAAPSSRRWVGWAGWAAFGLTLALGLLLWSDLRSSRSGASPRPEAARVGVWPTILKADSRTVVVVADGALATIQDVSGVAVSLDDYINRRYPPSVPQSGLDVLARRQFTGMASLLFVSRIVHLNGGRLDNLQVRHPRGVSVRDFQKDNHILLGSRHSNPWIALFHENRNFDLQFVGAPPSPCYHNRSPRPGESDAYCASSTSGEQYGVAAFLPNLSGTGSVLIIEGTTAEGTEAAWEFLSSGDRFEDFVRRHQLRDQQARLPYFELVLRAKTQGGAPVESAYVTHRTLAGRRP